jgi:aminoglycoside phosphotransferase (APT) family kinase protein
MDLHPLNILVGRSGPVVIDWTNAASGDPAVDVAVTWVLIASGEVAAGRAKAAMLGIGRKLLLDAFLKPFADEALRANLAEVVDWKCMDPNMSSIEIERMRSMVTTTTG